MDSLYKRFGSIVKGVLNGFDRIVFKGYIRPLMYPEGASSFLQSRKILNKDFKPWMQNQTGRIVADAELLSQAERGQTVAPFRSAEGRKDEVVRARHEELELADGLIGVWWAMESCSTFKARFAPGQSKPAIRREQSKCKHLYTYLNHAEYGLMHIRLQTWFPFGIQVAMNGREWLARSLEQNGTQFDRHRNKFLHIDDMAAAQCCLDAQLDVDWVRLLNDFLPIVFPAMKDILGPNLSYYWTLWQSEWATDYLFESPQALAPIAEQLLRHALITGTGDRVLRYLDRPFTKAGEPYASNPYDVSSRQLTFQDGIRVRHWVGSNSAKAYTEQNNLRLETTVNHPGMFKVFRHKEGAAADAPKERLPLRKSVADIPLRAAISQQVNDRLGDQLATCSLQTSFSDTVAGITRRTTRKGRKVRALDPVGKDRELLLAIADPAFTLMGVTNRSLREKLKSTIKGMTDKQAAAKASRLLRLLRDHQLIAKFPKQKRYRVTVKGMSISTAVAALLNASPQQLMENAA